MGDDTLSSTTSRSDLDQAEPRRSPGLAVLLECDRLGAAAEAFSLEGVDRVVLGRGAKRHATRLPGDKRTLRVEIPDQKISSDHAAIDRKGGGYRLSDLGSTNGTFVGAARVTEAELEPDGTFFRVGHTWLAVVGDGSMPAAASWPFPTLVASFRRDLDRLERMAATPIPLLFLGETGSGKEVVAKATHERSGRPGPFVAVNCGALPATLVESLLFGHKKGAFSGAVRDELGFVRQADGGTLFLDEVGDLPLVAQASLLRVLQEREVTSVGAFQPTKVEIRVLAATHRPLDRMVASGEFRADLYSRLSGFVFRIPPLRERLVDLGIIIERAFGARLAGVRLRPEAALALVEYDYPHNVRELTQALEAALVLAEGGVVRATALPPAMLAGARSAPPDCEARGLAAGPARTLSEEDQAIFDELSRRLHDSGGNLSQVARDMGKARQQIQRWMRRFGLRGKD